MSEMPPPIDPQLFTLAADGSPTLLAGRDRDTGRIAFPPPADDERFETIALPRHGRLWSWTVQRFRPKSPPYAGPDAFEPYAVGYVALGDTIIVEGRLTGVALDGYRIDMPMELVAIPFAMADGSMRTAFAFAPGAGDEQ
jgi:uncharacterized OB-fold protein